jgi:hypothetical protein
MSEETPNTTTLVTLMNICTNHYVNYWEQFAYSLDKVNTEKSIQIQVFTDQPTKIQEISSNLRNTAVTWKEIPSYGWPEATLFRFAIFNQFGDFTKDGVYVYTDADMLVLDSFLTSIQDFYKVGYLGVVLHPGYRHKLQIKDLRHLSGIKNWLRDVKLILRYGALGTWETDKRSLAFVPRAQREAYVCGGLWMADKSTFRQICIELARRIEQDFSQDLMACWHDESHLNWYVANHETILMPNELCVSGKQVNSMRKPLIVAVDK